MNQKGFISTAVVSISVIVLIILGGVAYYAINNFDNVNQEIAVSNALSTDLGLDVSGLDVNIKNITGGHARVEIVDPSGNSKTALVAKVNGTWRVVEYGNESYSCERANKFGFPGDLISDCVLQFPNAKTVTEAKDIINGVISENLTSDTFGVPNKVVVIGSISYPDDPSSGEIIIAGDDGETINIPLDSNIDMEQFTGVDEGDTVAVSVILDPSNSFSNSDVSEESSTSENSNVESGNSNSASNGSNTNSSSNTVIVAESVEEISGEILNTNTENVGSEGSSGSEANTGSGSGSSSVGSSNNEISEPSSSQSSVLDPDFNIYDIDNSNLNVKLIND